MDQLNQWYITFNHLTKDSPVLAGVVSLWGLTLVTVLLRNVPATIARFIARQTTTSLTFNNAGWGTNEVQFISFMEWFLSTRWAKWSRTLSLTGTTHHSTFGAASVGAGFGTHLFFYRGRPFWFFKRRLESSGSTIEKEEIEIRTIGRSQKPLLRLVETFKYQPGSNELGVYALKKGEWTLMTHIAKRPLSTVIVNQDTKDDIVSTLDHFYSHEEWYRNRGMAYKKTMVLHGPPGTGKTSFVKALASHYQRHIYQLSLNQVSDDSLPHIISEIRKGSFLLIEDFDSTSAVNERDVSKRNINIQSTGDAESFEVITLSGILNALDGVVALDDVVVFMTTNHIDNIDEALLRNGRVDKRVYLGPLGDKEIREYITLMYPQTPHPTGTFEQAYGCDLQDRFLTHREDAQGFIDSLAMVPKAAPHGSKAPTWEKKVYLPVTVEEV